MAPDPKMQLIIPQWVSQGFDGPVRILNGFKFLADKWTHRHGLQILHIRDLKVILSTKELKRTKKNWNQRFAPLLETLPPN